MPLFRLHPAGLLERIFEQIGIAVAVIDNKENVVFANQTATEMFGEVTKDKPVTFREWRRNYRFENSVGEQIPLEESAVMRALKGKHVESEELRLKFPDGSVKWFIAWAYPFSVMGLAGVLALITDETVEVELRRAASQLERLETLAVLAAGLTHDLNNMLDAISLSVELIMRENGLSEHTRTRLDQISAATRKAAGLVTRLMQFSRTQPFHFGSVQVGEVVRDVIRLVQSLLRDNIQLRTDLYDRLPYVLADRPQLEQALVNLIVNAIDAMPGGGELRISTTVESAAGTSETEEGQDFVCITVADTGVGISRELQSHIFEPFFTTKAPDKGTGLGLSSVYGIVKQHHGTVRVHSEPGKGSVFVISLPVQKANALTKPA